MSNQTFTMLTLILGSVFAWISTLVLIVNYTWSQALKDPLWRIRTREEFINKYSRQLVLVALSGPALVMVIWAIMK